MVALIHDSRVAARQRFSTSLELHGSTTRFTASGVQKGNAVLICMSMFPVAGIAMLAYTRHGATHFVVFGGFAENELAVRIDNAKPKLIVSAFCGIEPTRLVE